MKTRTSLKSILPLLLMLTAAVLVGCEDSSESDDDSTGGGGGIGDGGGTPPTGGAIVFDGTAKYLTVPNSWYAGDFTICLWMEPASVAGQTLLSMSAADKYFYLSFDNNEIDWKFESANDTDVTIDGTASFTAGNLYQVCVTGKHNAGSSTSTVYVNGALIGTANTATDGVASALTNLTIGHEPAPSFQSTDGNKTGSFNGVMDNVMIWSMQLPTNAITQLYGAGAGFDPQFAFSNYTVTHVSNLQVYYLMGNNTGDTISGSGAVIKDVMGNLDATPVGFSSGDLTEGLW